MPWEDEEEEEEEDGTAPAPPAAEAAARVVDEAESGCRLLLLVVVLAAARVAPAGEAKGGGRCDDADMVAGFERQREGAEGADSPGGPSTRAVALCVCVCVVCNALWGVRAIMECENDARIF